MIATRASLFGYETLIHPTDNGRFNLSIKLTIVDPDEKTRDKVVPISDSFGNETSAAMYARRWVERFAPLFLE